VYDDNGNPINAGQGQNAGRPGGTRNGGNNAGWTGTRGPALNNNINNQPNRFGDGSDVGGNNPNPNNMNGLGMQMGGFGMGLGSPTLGMGMPGLGMQPMSPFNMLSMMNMNPDAAAAQLLAAQMAASGQFGQPGMANWLGMQPMSAGIGPGGMGGNMGGRKPGPGSARSPGLRSASSVGSRGDGGNSTPRGDEDVDPALLNDVAAWLRSLRLHKYTPNFEGSKWQDMVMMDEAALEAKGVAALGARRKML
jgi:hypothetical protein